MITSFLNKPGSLGRRNSLSIAQQPLGYDKRTSSCKYRCVGNATSLITRSHRRQALVTPTLTRAPGGGIPHTLHHLGDLIRQQKRKKVLQEQNGQGNFDTLTGHHQQSPGQYRGTTHGSTEGKESSKKLTFPTANLSSSCQQTGLFITKFIYKE